MPIVTPTTITRPEDLVEHLATRIADSDLPFGYVAKYDEQLIPEYPAVQVFSAPFSKEVHGTHTFLITVRADLYIMHGDMTQNYVTRSLADMQLATRLVNFLESPDLSLDGRLIAGWVENEVPGAMPPRTAKSASIVSTKLGYRGTSEARF